MPQITEKRINIDARWFSSERDVQRTKGLHLSAVLDYIESQEGKSGREYGKDLSPAGHAYASLGFLWERVLDRLIELDPAGLWEWMFGRALAEVPNPKVVRPGEQRLEAGNCTVCKSTGKFKNKKCVPCCGTGIIYIYLTPDALNIETSMLEEYKLTTKSCTNPIDGNKFRRWLSFQIPAYLKAMCLTECLLRVCFAHGDWRGDPAPVWVEYTLVYTQQEIDETWDCISQNALALVEQQFA